MNINTNGVRIMNMIKNSVRIKIMNMNTYGVNIMSMNTNGIKILINMNKWSKHNEYEHKWCKYFPNDGQHLKARICSGANSFLNEIPLSKSFFLLNLSTREANRKSQKVSRFEKWWKNTEVYLECLNEPK